MEKGQKVEQKITALSLAAAIAFGLLGFRGPAVSRSLELTERLRIEVPKGARSLRVWIPLAVSDAHQKAELLKVEAPFPYRLTEEPEFGNRLLFLEANPTSGLLEIQTTSRITRLEQAVSSSEAVSPLDLEPRGLVIVDERVRKIARETVGDLTQPLEKARALYQYVLGAVDYDTSGAGWGRGDVAYVCDVKKGNCTDFHSLFIALCYAENIPARFRMGLPLPRAQTGSIEKKYHCWAEFFIKGKGWIPVDISEAWKHPAKAEYYFGRLDANRILISTGREIELSPKQKGQRLNFLSQPYVEIDGRPFFGSTHTRSYRNKKGGKT